MILTSPSCCNDGVCFAGERGCINSASAHCICQKGASSPGGQKQAGEERRGCGLPPPAPSARLSPQTVRGDAQHVEAVPRASQGAPRASRMREEEEGGQPSAEGTGTGRGEGGSSHLREPGAEREGSARSRSSSSSRRLLPAGSSARKVREGNWHKMETYAPPPTTHAQGRQWEAGEAGWALSEWRPAGVKQEGGEAVCMRARGSPRCNGRCLSSPRAVSSFPHLRRRAVAATLSLPQGQPLTGDWKAVPEAAGVKS